MVDIIKKFSFKIPAQEDITYEMKYDKFITAKSLHNKDILSR